MTCRNILGAKKSLQKISWFADESMPVYQASGTSQ